MQTSMSLTAYVAVAILTAGTPPAERVRAAAVWTRFAAAAVLEIASPVAATSGDFNRDGRPDLAIAEVGSKIQILLQGNSPAGFWKALAPFQVGENSFFVRAGDLDGDGIPDLVTCDTSTFTHFLRGRGDGTFEAPLRLRDAPGTRWAAIADLDGDGKLDLATANYYHKSVSVFRGGGNPPLVFLKRYELAGDPHSIEASDLDGDGRVDLAAGVPSQGLLPLWGRQGGDFEIGTSSKVLGFDAGVRYLTTGDVNRDGRSDLAASSGLLVLSRGGGAFEIGLDSRLPAGVIPPVIADFDGDGHLDAAFVHPSGVHLFPGEGTGRFRAARSVPVSGRFPYFAIGSDLDLQGGAELVALDIDQSTLAIFCSRPGDNPEDKAFEAAWIQEPPLGKPRALAIADFDRDGRLDVILADGTAARAGVYFQPGLRIDGEPDRLIPLPAILDSLAALDLDVDGFLDLAGTSRVGGTFAAVFLDAAGDPRRSVFLEAGAGPEEPTAADLDGDGLLDVAVPCSLPSTVALFFQRSGGEFEAEVRLPTIARPRAAARGDFDGDGIVDLAVAGTGGLAVHHGKGGGDLLNAAIVAPRGVVPFTQLATADVTGDGLDDLAALEPENDRVRFFAGSRGRVYAELRGLQTPRQPGSMRIEDLDGDGSLDVVLGSGWSRAVWVHRGSPGGAFGPPVGFLAGIEPELLRLADLDGDGLMDAVALGKGSLSVLHGVGEEAAGFFRRGDTDSDGVIGIDEPIRLLNHLFLGAPAPSCPDAADADDSGRLDITDPVHILIWLFLGGPPPPEPGPERCAHDPTPDALPACEPVPLCFLRVHCVLCG